MQTIANSISIVWLVVVTAVVAILLASCSEPADVVLWNKTGHEVWVMAPDHSATEVANGRNIVFKFPGLPTRPVRIRDGTADRRYTMIEYPPVALRAQKYPHTVYLVLENDFRIDVSTPSGDPVSEQPSGYPLQPN
jgi:hypothetical protein